MTRKYTIHASLFLFLIAAPVFGQIVNKSTLKIAPGTLLYLGADFTNTSSGQLDSEGDIHVKGDFINDGTVTATAGTVYFDSSTNATQNLNGSVATAQFYNLSINNTATAAQGLAVVDGFNLEVTNGVDITAGKLRLMGESQLIQTHTGISANTGTKHLLIDQQGAKNAYRFNYWSSPVHNDGVAYYTVDQVIKDGTISNLFNPINIGFTTSYNGNDSGSPVQVSAYWFYKFINGDTNSGAGWEPLFNSGTTTLSTNANLSPAEGYIMKGVNATAAYADKQNYSFEGVPNDGDYVINLQANKSYLVGNPYPCALDANAFIQYNAVDNAFMDGTLYFWEHWSTDTHVYTEYGGNYATYTLSGGTVPSSPHPDFVNGSGSGSIMPERYIPVAQGFMIESETTSGGPVTFKNAQRVFRVKGDNSNFFRSAHPENTGVASRFWLNYIAPNNGTRQLLLAFTNGIATDSFDRGYDGKLEDANLNDVYFTMEDEGRNFAYGIQGVGNFDVEKKYPLVLKCGEAGVHTISLGTVENLDIPIYILDELTQTTYDLTQSDFRLNLEAGIYTDRFKVVFQPSSSLATNENTILNNSIKLYYFDDSIVILNPNHIKIKQLNVFNTLGQLVLKNNFEAYTTEAKIIIPFNFAQTTYFLLGTSEYGSFSTKIFNY